MIQLNKLLKSYGFYMFSAFGISLTIKANVGVSSFNSMNVALANATDIKIGTITMGINIIFLLMYMMMTKFELKQKYFVQLISLFMFGSFINFFTYIVLQDFVIKAYMLRVITVALGTFIGGLSVGMIVSYNTITFPIESVCLHLSERSKHTFTKLRYSVDIFSIIVSLSVSYAFDLPLYVREGTLISLMIFSFTIGKVKKLYADRQRKSEAVLS